MARRCPRAQVSALSLRSTHRHPCRRIGILAGAFAGAATFCTNPAMFMVPAMFFALFGAQPTGFPADREGELDYLLTAARAARTDGRSCAAEVRTVQIEANALDEL